METNKALRHPSTSDIFFLPRIRLSQGSTTQPVPYLKDYPYKCVGTFKSSREKPKALLHKIPSISKCIDYRCFCIFEQNLNRAMLGLFFALEA